MSVEYLHGLWDRGALQLAKLGLDQEQIEGALAIMTSEIAAISPSVREAADGLRVRELLIDAGLEEEDQ